MEYPRGNNQDGMHTRDKNPQWRSQYTSDNKDLYFHDGKRRIDFVLVYSKFDRNPENEQKREQFLNGLAHEMVEIEVEDCYGKLIGCTSAKVPQECSATLIEPVIETPIQASVATDVVESQSAVAQERRKSSKKDAAKGRPSDMDRYRLQVEEESAVTAETDDLVFVKLHAPWKVMCIYAEKFNFRKQLNVPDDESNNEAIRSPCSACCTPDNELLKPLRTTLTWPFNQQREFLYDIPENKDEFFTDVERSLVLDYILKRTRYVPKVAPPAQITDEPQSKPINLESADEQKNPIVGITKLLSEGVFLAAYPLHEPCKSSKTTFEINNRTLLRRCWASFRSFSKPQPLDYVRFYFGEAVGFYFAWLGFYTACLVPVAVLGVLVFLFGLLRLSRDPIQEEVCDHGAGVVMCPLCSSESCKFWTLDAACLRTRLTQLVDNEGTVLFGVIMALWAIVFLELWKRKQISLAYRWNVFALEPVDQPARPEFLALLDKGYKRSRNPISENYEPVVPFWRKRFPCYVLSYTTVLFAVILTLACLVGVILYKIVMKIVFYHQPNVLVQSTAGMLTTVTGSVINLILIFVLQFLYNRVAIKMTDMEDHRTQIEYDNSLTLKLYLLQFVNYYSSVFYIAFIQGTTAALPGSKHIIVQSTGCDQGDCLFELFLQLIIIMVGKQALSFIKEAFMPVILRIVYSIRMKTRRSKMGASAAAQASNLEASGQPSGGQNLLTCRADFKLLDPGSRLLFDEYLEMMIQFGFITMFVPAFPLAPFFGLLNNLFEIRGDAKKFVNMYRRPVVDRVKNIGIWYSILLVLSSIAIRTNACVIAFTTQFIDRWVYRLSYSTDLTNSGFKNFTLSYMQSSRFTSHSTSEYCRYDDYRKPPWEDPNFGYTSVYYHVLAVKFIFVFIFETVAILLTSLIAAMIPDIPDRITTRIYREANQTSKLMVYALTAQARGSKTTEAQMDKEVKKDTLAKLHGAGREEGVSDLMPLEFYSLIQSHSYDSQSHPLSTRSLEPDSQLPLPPASNERFSPDEQTVIELQPLLGFDGIVRDCDRY